MTKKSLDWAADETYPAGKGATEQHFTSSANGDRLEIVTHPWGEADLKINYQTIAHVEDDLSAGDAFRDLERIAEEIETEKPKADPAGSKR